MDDDVAIMQGACIIYAAGVASGNTVTMLDATRLSSIALGRARSPEMVGLVGAACAYPQRTHLVENGIAGVISSAYRERLQELFDTLAVVLKKLFYSLGRLDGGTIVTPIDERCSKKDGHDG